MKKLIFLLFCFFLGSSHAAIPPTNYGVRFTPTRLGVLGYGGTYKDAIMSNVNQNCEAAKPATSTFTGTAYSSGTSAAYCRYSFPSGSTSDYVLNGSFATGIYSICPANSTLSSGACTCNSGYTENNGQCLVYVDPCANTQGLPTGYKNLEVQFDNVKPTPAALGSFIGQNVTTGVPINGNNCAATGVVESCALGGSTMYCVLSGTKYGGATYNNEQSLFGLPKVDPEATPENELTKVCPTGQYPGEVNGTQVCVKSSGSANTTQSTTTNPDGTSSTTSTTTSCVGDQCSSSTTTTTKDAQGNTTGSGSSKTEGDKDAFCVANPQSPECKNTKSGFSGTCGSSFKCESDDAVMCAIALDQHKSNCEILRQDENLGSNLANIINDPLNELDFPDVPISAPQAPGGGGCSITPFSIQVGMGSFMVDFTHLCAYLGIIKSIVVAFGAVMWTLIVFVRPN